MILSHRVGLGVAGISEFILHRKPLRHRIYRLGYRVTLALATFACWCAGGTRAAALHISQGPHQARLMNCHDIVTAHHYISTPPPGEALCAHVINFIEVLGWKCL